MKSEYERSNRAAILARQALQNGNRLQARRWAEKAISLSSENEDAWLILAAMASPRASISYLKRALEINPKSKRARKGMHWAIQRLREEQSQHYQDPTTQITKQRIKKHKRTRKSGQKTRAILPWLVTLTLLVCLLSVGFTFPRVLIIARSMIPAGFSNNIVQYAFTQYNQIIASPTPRITSTSPATFTSTITASQTPTETPLPTLTNTFTPAPSETPTTTPTSTAIPSFTPSPTMQASPTFTSTSTPKPLVNRPSDVDNNERWIDIDLSEQRTYAFEGDQMINKFRVSTGTSRTPTITGQYRIYVKYRTAHMSGPGYYLPNVPYVMYFYKGYGLHGTYWHNNFGTPMSHGCVNLKNEDAAWLFSWASVGTVVYIHP